VPFIAIPVAPFDGKDKVGAGTGPVVKDHTVENEELPLPFTDCTCQ
jgi:hypothetical protein